MALDYLPIQATSVPCERLFSSAALTDTPRRNRINADLMEALQMCKYSIRQERLNLMSFWSTSIEMMLTTGTQSFSRVIVGPNKEASDAAVAALADA